MPRPLIDTGKLVEWSYFILFDEYVHLIRRTWNMPVHHWITRHLCKLLALSDDNY